MPNWKKVIVSGSDAALSSLNVSSALTASGLIYPTSDGTSGQLIQTDGAGNLSFIDGASEDVTTTVKNVAGVTLAKGTPVHAVSGSSSGNVTPVIAASASVASTMPATFILGEELADEEEGTGIVVGAIKGVDTSAFNVGDIVYVGEDGGYTNVKPTGSGNLIQNLGVVTKVHASNGSGFIYGSGRSNDVPNLPTGKIWVGNGNTVTSSLVHLDESNGRLGIGTTSPEEKLSIRNGRIQLENQRDITWSDLGDGNTSRVSIRGTEDDDWIMFRTDNSERMRLTNTGLGIGTGSPKSLLDVAGDAVIGNSVDDKLRLTGSLDLNTGGGTYYISGSDSTLSIGSLTTANKVQLELYHALNPVSLGITYNGGSALPYIESVHSSYDTNTHLLFKPGGTENWRIGAHGSNHTYTSAFSIKPASNGYDFYIANHDGVPILYSETNSSRIGIGTTAPGYKLDVNSGTANAAMRVSSTDRYTGINFTDSTGNTTLFYDGQDDRLYTAANFRTTADAEITGDLTVGGIVTAQEFHTEFVSASIMYESGSTKFGDTGDDNHDFTGSLGLSGSLSVDGSSGATATFRGATQSTVDFKAGSTSNYIVGTPTGDLSLRPSGSTQVTLKGSTGRVGIGTTSPSSKLDVAGSAIFSNSIGVTGANDPGTNAPAAEIQYRTSDKAGRFYGYDRSTASYLNMSLGNDNLYIPSSSGYVGIGTTSPAYPLDVNGSMRADSYRIGGATVLSGTATVQLGSGGATSAITLNTTSGEGLRLTGASVGIGTTAPTQKLEVRDGNLVVSSSNSEVVIGTSSGKPRMQSNGNQDLLFSTANQTNVLYLQDANGNVGIGTTSPQKKLHVAGHISSSAFYGDGSNLTGVTTSDGLADILSNSNEASGQSIDMGSGNITQVGELSGESVNVTTASIAYVTSSANLHIDTNVGIGTASPSEKLHIEGNVLVTGTVTAQEFHTDFVSASIIYESGSTKFGDDTGDSHDFTGSLNASGALSIDGDGTIDSLNVREFIRHNGDANTYLHFASTQDKIEITAGGVEMITLTEGSADNVHINAGGVDVDFQVSANNDNHALFVNGGTDRVGIGTASPSSKLHVSGAMIIDSGSQATKLDSNRFAVTSTATVISDIDPTVYVGAVFDYTAYHNDKTTGMRTGQLMLAFDESTNVTISDVTTTDIGDTSGVTFTATNNGSSVRVSYNTPDADWNIRLFRRLL